MRARWVLLAIVIALVASACGGGGGSDSSGGDSGLGTDTTIATSSNAACKNAKLASTDVGVTADTITVTTAADVQNAFRPGLFKGAWDGTQAWADYINSQGGLACRKVVVKTVDSHLNPEDSKASIEDACGNSFATVGTTELFLVDVKAMNACKDKAGAATGLPDVALLQTDASHQCSPVSFAALPTNSACPYSGSGPRTFGIIPTSDDYYMKTLGMNNLHAVFVVPKDTPSTIASAMPVFRGDNKLGVKSDAEFGMSGLATQAEYTSVVQAIKQHNSNFVNNMLDYTGTVLLRKEAAAQDANQPNRIWDCELNCYDNRLISEGGSAVEGQYTWLSFLPLEDKGSNPELDAYIAHSKEPNAWSMQAWLAGEIFARAVNDAMAAHGNDPNAVTRANVLTALRNLHDFDANGMMAKTDVGAKTRSACLVGMQVKNGKFVRVDPVQPGTFDCDGNKPLPTVTIDPVAEYKG